MNASARKAIPLWIGLVPIAALIGLAHLIPGLDRTPLDAELRNATHIVGFAIVAAILYRFLRGSRSKRILVTLALVVTFGIISELLQYIYGMTFSFEDLLKDVAGAGLYITAFEFWSCSRRARTFLAVVVCRVIAVGLATVIVAPLFYWTTVRISAYSRLPTIADFEQPWEEKLIKPKNSVLTVTSKSEDMQFGKPSNNFLLIKLNRRGRSGLIIKALEPDWTRYTVLEFDAATASDETVWVSAYVNDGLHAGMFGGKPPMQFEVTKEPARISIHLDSTVQNPDGTRDILTDVSEMAVLGHGEHENVIIMLDNLALR